MGWKTGQIWSIVIRPSRNTYLEVYIVWQQKEPRPAALASAKAKDIGEVITAEGWVGHHHIVLRQFLLTQDLHITLIDSWRALT